jgi:50S ribosomal protein L16 3-hydroxylase
MHRNILGGLTASQFLRTHWQKKPLLVRSALPSSQGFVDLKRLSRLAIRPEVESRLVLRDGANWRVHDGPLSRRHFQALPATCWTLLVHGLNLYLPQADRLFRRFDFIPYARLDDLMVSYAAPQGGVGPHFDSYDVFLLQGPGTRRWQIARQKDRTFIEEAPLKLLKNFQPQQEYLLAPGDMLYLPPGYAHSGIALEACITYSIGFRAPSAQELAMAFLEYLQDNLRLRGQYRDPNLEPQCDPARISARMVSEARRMLAEIEWTRRDVARFLGLYLTEPKANVLFDPPTAPLSEPRFRRQAKAQGLTLDRKTQMLFLGGTVYLNGEAHPMRNTKLISQFANKRTMPPQIDFDPESFRLFYQWYLAGYLHAGGARI